MLLWIFQPWQQPAFLLTLRCTYQHCKSVRNSKTFLELMTCSRLYSSRNWEYLSENVEKKKENKRLNVSFCYLWYDKKINVDISFITNSFKLTDYWWNACGSSKQFWQNALVSCLEKTQRCIAGVWVVAWISLNLSYYTLKALRRSYRTSPCVLFQRYRTSEVQLVPPPPRNGWSSPPCACP